MSSLKKVKKEIGPSTFYFRIENVFFLYHKRKGNLTFLAFLLDLFTYLFFIISKILYLTDEL